MKATNKKLNEAIDNAQQFMQQMQRMNDNKLSLHIDLFQQQIEMAYKQNNQTAIELLQHYQMQTITARANKL